MPWLLLHRVPLSLSDSISSRLPAIEKISTQVLTGVFITQISALRVSGPRVPGQSYKYSLLLMLNV